MKIVALPAEAEIEVKKSRFLAKLVPAANEEEARAALEEIRRVHRDARHHCFAMRFGTPKQVLERFSDDGEPQGTAGKPMLELLKGNELYDVCAVVTRYFGGTLLGTGGLVRAYADALKEAIAGAEIYALSDGVRASVSCDYGLSNQIKYVAEQMELMTESETYTERCCFTYLMPAELYPVFADKVTQLSSGRAAAERLQIVRYYTADRPTVYQIL